MSLPDLSVSISSRSCVSVLMVVIRGYRPYTSLPNLPVSISSRSCVSVLMAVM